MHVPRPLLRAVVRTTVRPVLSDRVAPPRQRAIIDALSRAAVLPRGTTVERSRTGGVACEVITTARTSPDTTLLFLHGGGYTVGSPTTHRALAAHLADTVGATTHLLDYRLAPEHPWPAAVDDAVAAYRSLVEGAGAAPGRLLVAGDSAGGGLALALALRARTLDLPLPTAIGLISPWVDARLDGLDESVHDPLLTRAWLERCAQHYAGEHRERPEVSPLLADLAGLPPLFVHGASDEILLADIERFVVAAERHGVPVTYRRLHGHWHDTHLYAGLMLEATEAVEQLGGWLRAAVTASR